jgi:hypothetical protein
MAEAVPLGFVTAASGAPSTALPGRIAGSPNASSGAIDSHVRKSRPSRKLSANSVSVPSPQTSGASGAPSAVSRLSSPGPPSIVSRPAPPVRASSPGPPLSLSSPAPPEIASFPPPPSATTGPANGPVTVKMSKPAPPGSRSVASGIQRTVTASVYVFVAPAARTLTR